MLITVPMHEMSLQAEEGSINCYECYKHIPFPQLQLDEKYFCSEACMEKYLSLLKVSVCAFRSFVQAAGYPSSRRKATANKACGSARWGAVPTTSRSKTCSSNGTQPAPDTVVLLLPQTLLSVLAKSSNIFKFK